MVVFKVIVVEKAIVVDRGSLKASPEETYLEGFAKKHDIKMLIHHITSIFLDLLLL